MKNYYQLLGVNEQATEHEIQLAYTFMYHKYNSGGYSSVNKEEQLIDILVAYNALTNNKVKKEYDKVLRENLDKVQHISIESPHLPAAPRKVSMLAIVSVAALLLSFAYTIYLIAGYAKENKDLTAIRKEYKKEQVTNIAQKPIQPEVKAEQLHNVVASSSEKKIPNTNKEAADKKVLHAKEVKPNMAKEVLLTHSKVAEPVVTDRNIERDEVATKNKWEKGEVLKMRGTPNAIVRFDKENEVWCYNNGNIKFNNGKTTTRPQN